MQFTGTETYVMDLQVHSRQEQQAEHNHIPFLQTWSQSVFPVNSQYYSRGNIPSEATRWQSEIQYLGARGKNTGYEKQKQKPGELHMHLTKREKDAGLQGLWFRWKWSIIQRPTAGLDICITNSAFLLSSASKSLSKNELASYVRNEEIWGWKDSPVGKSGWCASTGIWVRIHITHIRS